jgi:hypothetical protein
MGARATAEFASTGLRGEPGPGGGPSCGAGNSFMYRDMYREMLFAGRFRALSVRRTPPAKVLHVVDSRKHSSMLPGDGRSELFTSGGGDASPGMGGA